MFLQRKKVTHLHRAVYKGDATKVESLLNEPTSDFNARDIKGRTALHFALGSNGRKHDHEISQMLLKNKSVDVDTEDEDGLTPLFYASDAECLSCSELILNRGAKMECGSISPLIHASKWNNMTILRLLLDKGASVNTRVERHYTALHYAVEMNNEEAAQLLIDRGADITLKNSWGRTAFDIAEERHNENIMDMFLLRMKGTALHRAVVNCDTRMVASLMKESACDFNARDIKGRTALHFALGSNGGRHEHEISQMLLRNESVDVDAEDEDGLTPLYNATDAGCVSCVESILNRRANVDGGSKSALINACERNNIKILRLLCERAEDLNVAEEEQNTPLHVAARRRNTEGLQILLEKGAFVDAKNNEGITPLHYVSKYGHLEGVKLLIQHGADIESTDNRGSTALFHACGWYTVEVISLLINHGANINHRNNDGNTPLHQAVMDRQNGAVKLLLKAGADRTIINNEGKCALDVAEHKEFF